MNKCMFIGKIESKRFVKEKKELRASFIIRNDFKKSCKPFTIEMVAFDSVASRILKADTDNKMVFVNCSMVEEYRYIRRKKSFYRRNIFKITYFEIVELEDYLKDSVSAESGIDTFSFCDEYDDWDELYD